MALCFEKYIVGPLECCKWPGKPWKARDGTKRELGFSAEFLRTAREAGGRGGTETGQKEVGGKASEQQEGPTGNGAGVPHKVTANAKLQS